MMKQLEFLIEVAIAVAVVRWFDYWIPSNSTPFVQATYATALCLALIAIHCGWFVTSAIRRQGQGDKGT